MPIMAVKSCVSLTNISKSVTMTVAGEEYVRKKNFKGFSCVEKQPKQNVPYGQGGETGWEDIYYRKVCL